MTAHLLTRVLLTHLSAISYTCLNQLISVTAVRSYLMYSYESGDTLWEHTILRSTSLNQATIGSLDSNPPQLFASPVHLFNIISEPALTPCSTFMYTTPSATL